MGRDEIENKRVVYISLGGFLKDSILKMTAKVWEIYYGKEKRSIIKRVMRMVRDIKTKKIVLLGSLGQNQERDQYCQFEVKDEKFSM